MSEQRRVYSVQAGDGLHQAFSFVITRHTVNLQLKETMPPKTWQFLSTGSDGKLANEDTRRLVRENAMRNFRQSERLARVQEYQHMQMQTRSGKQQGHSIGQNQEEETYRDRRSLPPEDTRPGQTFPLNEPGLGVDPFALSQLPDHKWAPRLFAHCEFILFFFSCYAGIDGYGAYVD
jgi:hypothetical protein